MVYTVELIGLLSVCGPGTREGRDGAKGKNRDLKQILPVHGGVGVEGSGRRPVGPSRRRRVKFSTERNRVSR